MDAARRYMEKGQVDRAVKEYLRVVAEDPGDVRVWLKIGDLYVKKGAKREATETYLRVATFYSDQGFYLKAVAVYKQILKINPRLVEVNLKLAELYRQLGLMSDAMQHFEMVAGHFHREGKTKEALATVRQLVDLDPENVATRIKLAELYSKEGMIEEAVAEFARACDQLRASNREDDFVKVAERMLYHKADNLALSRELAEVYLRRNDPRRALQKLQICFKANSRDIDTLTLLANAFQSLEQTAKTVSVLKEMARVLEEDGKREEAVKVHQRILSLVPGDRDSQAQVGKPATGAPPPGVPPVPPAPPKRQRQLTMSAFSGIPEAQDPSATGAMPLLDVRNGPAYMRGPSMMEQLTNRRQPSAGVPADPAFESSPSGEAHADEISKILTESDVYVKYGLHDKAIEHLRRVFTLDATNIEARERLKEILLSLDRGTEAIAELMRLAELAASRAPERAASYLREILSIDRRYQPAFDLAQRLGIRLIGGAAQERADSGRRGPGQPAPAAAQGAGDDEFLLSMDEPEEAPDTSLITVDLSPEELEALDVVIEERAAANRRAASAPGSFFATEIGSLPGDPGPPAADNFDGATQVVTFDPTSGSLIGAEQISDIVEPFSATDGPPTRVMDELSLDISEESIEFELGAAMVTSVEETVDLRAADLRAPGNGRSGDHPHARPAGRIDDDLDEADFFMAQGLYSEARNILNGLLASHPNHPLLMAKLQEIDELERAGHGMMPSGGLGGGASPTQPGDRHSHQSVERPTVMLERPIEDEDADTHYDLGLAYKEMGLFQEAIQAFEKVSGVPGREVQCRIMIGLCYREQGDILEAINHFKAALHTRGISDPEQLSLYYEIAVSYETIVNDTREALYFYELIRKKTGDYRDVEARVKALQSRAGRKQSEAHQPRGRSFDDADAAIDSLLAESDDSGRRRH